MRPLVALLALAMALLGSSGERAFTPGENATLERGGTVTSRESVNVGSGHYVGGHAYVIIDASPEELDALFEDVSTYPRILPYTKASKLIGREGGDLLVWLRQGTSILDASYTVRVRKEARPGRAASAPGEARTVRFWLDLSRPHGIKDASGFFRYAPIAPGSRGQPRVLLTFGVWVDLGSGIVRALFEGRIQRAVLTVPQHLRTFVAERSRRI